jgi:hypothetical protein
MANPRDWRTGSGRQSRTSGAGVCLRAPQRFAAGRCCWRPQHRDRRRPAVRNRRCVADRWKHRLVGRGSKRKLLERCRVRSNSTKFPPRQARTPATQRDYEGANLCSDVRLRAVVAGSGSAPLWFPNRVSQVRILPGAPAPRAPIREFNYLLRAGEPARLARNTLARRSRVGSPTTARWSRLPMS